MEIDDNIRSYKDRLRIFLILYFFSENISKESNSENIKIFKSEVKIQKIDFLIRNPDYLAYELLSLAKQKTEFAHEIRNVIKTIFINQEPVLRRLEMERFFFGAYEDIDDVIAFLKSIGFINFSSKKSSDLKTIDKQYFITRTAVDKVNNMLEKLPALSWYAERCQLIKRFFGDLTGNQLKVLQYQIPEYRNTSYKEFIGDIQDTVRKEFANLYYEQL